MKLFPMVLLSALSLAACKTKTVVEEIVIPLPPGSLDFRITRQINESTISFQWNGYPEKRFSRYEIVREYWDYRNGNFFPVKENIKTFNRHDSVTFTDDRVPFASKISYILTAHTPAGPDRKDTLTYTPAAAFYNDNLRDVIIDRQRKVLYMVSFAKWYQVSVYDYVGKKFLKTVELPAHGFIDYNPAAGPKGELYVGTVDGWLLILDPETLAQIDKIFVQGNQVQSVQAMNGLLVVSTTDYVNTPETENSRKVTKVYRRSTKEFLSFIGHTGNARMLYLGGNRLLEVMPNIGPSPGWAIDLDANGVENAIKWMYGPFNTDILRTFPASKRFISGSEGKIYNDKMEETMVLGTTGQFQDFAVSADESVIYAADKNTQSVNAIRLSDKTILKSYPYKLNMYSMQVDGDHLVMISSYYDDPVHRGLPPFIFETVKL